MNATCVRTNPSILSRRALLTQLSEHLPGKSRSTYIMQLRRMLKDGTLVHVGRDAYQLAGQASFYEYVYSKNAQRLAAFLSETYPLVDFRILEFLQCNEFINHLLGHNTILLSVEKDVMDFVFDALQERQLGRVLIHPSVDDFHRYRKDDIIVIEPLLTEAPHSYQGTWQTGLEKFLVDLVADKYLRSSISEGELPQIYETAFERYTVDERKLFRYARRRNAAQKIQRIIKEETSITLRMGPPC